VMTRSTSIQFLEVQLPRQVLKNDKLSTGKYNLCEREVYAIISGSTNVQFLGVQLSHEVPQK
jgi:hypothetical protein